MVTSPPRDGRWHPWLDWLKAVRALLRYAYTTRSSKCTVGLDRLIVDSWMWIGTVTSARSDTARFSEHDALSAQLPISRLVKSMMTVEGQVPPIAMQHDLCAAFVRMTEEGVEQPASMTAPGRYRSKEVDTPSEARR